MTDERDSRQATRTRTVLIAILFILILMLIGLGFFVVTIVAPAGKPTGTGGVPVGLEWVRSIYGYGPKLADQLYRPTDTAVGPDGTIYGTDPQRSRILVFNPDGTYKTMIQTGPGAAGPGRLYRPMALTVDTEGNAYICEYQNHRVMVFSTAGRLLREWDVPAPTGAAVTGDRVYVTTSYGVAVFSLDGKLLATWGKRGRGPDEFDNPRGIVAGPDGTLYISDTLNGRVKAYSRDGVLLWVWPEDRRTAKPTGLRPSAKSGPVQLPSGAAIDGQGRLVFVDPFAFQLFVLKVSPKGAKQVAAYGEAGEKDGYFTYPSGLAYDSTRDWFVVADTTNDRLQIVRIPGSAANPLTAAIARTTTGPAWLCLVPVVLLLLAGGLAVARRRSRRGLVADAD